MLPGELRMRRSSDFARTVRSGVRAGRPTVIVHCRAVPGRDGVQVGFVVGRAVGGAVTRNRVRRRLRGAVTGQRDALPQGCDVVVRALPGAAEASYERLATDLTGALSAAVSRVHGATR